MTTNAIADLLLMRLDERDKLAHELESQPWLIVERRRLRVVRKEIIALVGKLEECDE